MADEKEIDIINDLLVKRQKALNSGNESEAMRLEEEFKKAGFEVFDGDNMTSLKKKNMKKKCSI